MRLRWTLIGLVAFLVTGSQHASYGQELAAGRRAGLCWPALGSLAIFIFALTHLWR